MKKRLLYIFVLFMTIFGSTNVFGISYPDANVTVNINGKVMDFDVNPVNIDGRILVPLRAIFEELGAKVEWQQETGRVTGISGDTTVALQLDNKIASIDGKDIVLDVAATSVNGRTMVPVRFVSQALGAEVDWNNENRTVIVSDLMEIEDEVEVIDFNMLLNESNDRRKAELKKGYIHNFSNYMGDFSKTLDYFTEDEVKSLLARKNRTFNLTQAQAIEDVEIYFKYLETNYAAYDYFGGSEAFNEAKEKVLQTLLDKSHITYNEFASILQSAMGFVRDGHFSINGVTLARQRDVRHEYYRSDNQKFSKDEGGYYKVYNDTKWYVTGFSNDAVSIKPTLLSSGKIVYSPVFFAPVTQLEEASQVTLYNGVTTKTETINWVPTSTFNGQNLDVGRDLIKNLSGTKYIPFRRPFFTDKNISVYENAGSILKKERVFILDSRSNNGGGDRQQQPWFRAFTGKTFNYREVVAYKVNKFSIVNFANHGNRNANQPADLGKWRTRMMDGQWFPNNTKIIVLMDDMTGSSGESMIYMLRTLDNVIFVGSNTYGAQIAGHYVDIYLPNSGMPIRSGMMLAFPETDGNIDGIGIEPDIWTDPNSSLEAVRNMIKHYGIN